VRLNEGGAMDPTKGIFTAPVPGIYKFELTAYFFTHTDDTFILKFVLILLKVNEDWHVDKAYSPLTTRTDDFLSMSTSLRLKKGDIVRLYKDQIGVLDFYEHHQHTHFSGWLVEEDLV